MVSTRGGVSNKVNPKQIGLAGKKRGAIPGRKYQRQKRRSERKQDGLDSSDLSSDDEDSNMAVVEPPITRNTPVTCLTFCKHHKALYPDHFFCGHCDDWERDTATLSRKAKRASDQFCCEAIHFSP
jgi:hypothetical protein